MFQRIQRRWWVALLTDILSSSCLRSSSMLQHAALQGSIDLEQSPHESFVDKQFSLQPFRGCADRELPWMAEPICMIGRLKSAT